MTEADQNAVQADDRRAWIAPELAVMAAGAAENGPLGRPDDDVNQS